MPIRDVAFAADNFHDKIDSRAFGLFPIVLALSLPFSFRPALVSISFRSDYFDLVTLFNW